MGKGFFCSDQQINGDFKTCKPLRNLVTDQIREFTNK